MPLGSESNYLDSVCPDRCHPQLTARYIEAEDVASECLIFVFLQVGGGPEGQERRAAGQRR